LDEFIEVCSGYIQNVPHIAAARIAWTDSVSAICAYDFSLRRHTELYDDLSLGVEPMYVTGFVIFRIGYKPNSVEAN
jgi:hypothetical protein